MGKKTIDEKNISRAFSTLKDYQKNRIVKAISEYLASTKGMRTLLSIPVRSAGRRMHTSQDAATPGEEKETLLRSKPRKQKRTNVD